MFEQLNKYINEVLWLIIQNQNLCKYLYYDTANTVDPLSMPELTDEQRTSLLFNHIFPLPKLPTNEDIKATSYLTVFFDNIEKGGSIYFKDSLLTFNIFCHLDLWRIPDKLRVYGLMEEIDSIFNNKSIIGIGTIQFYRSRLFSVNKDFAGYTLTYRVVDSG
jgi:hypothetical protein